MEVNRIVTNTHRVGVDRGARAACCFLTDLVPAITAVASSPASAVLSGDIPQARESGGNSRLCESRRDIDLVNPEDDPNWVVQSFRMGT